MAQNNQQPGWLSSFLFNTIGSIFFTFPSWVINDVIFPRLFFLLPAGLKRKAQERQETRLQNLRLRPVNHKLSAILTRMEEIMMQGSHAEDKAMEILNSLASRNPELKIRVFEAEGSMAGIVLPADISTQQPSHEFDALLVSVAGVFVIETKGWKDINADGTHVAPDGKLLKPAHQQSRPKVQRLRDLIGNDVPVHSLVLLPNLDPLDAPAALHPSYVCDASQLQLAIRGKIQRLNGKVVDVDDVYRTIDSALADKEWAKLGHMLWLADTHPNADALEIKRLNDKYNSILEDRLVRHNWWKDNWRMLMYGSLFVSFWVFGLMPVEVTRKPLWGASTAAAQDTGASVDPGPANKNTGQKPASKKKPASKPKTPVVSEEELARMTAGSIPGKPEWAHSCETITDHRGFKVCDPEKHGVVFNEAGQVVLEGQSVKSYTAALFKYCPKESKRVFSTGPLGTFSLRRESLDRIKIASNAYWLTTESKVMHSYYCQM